MFRPSQALRIHHRSRLGCQLLAPSRHLNTVSPSARKPPLHVLYSGLDSSAPLRALADASSSHDYRMPDDVVAHILLDNPSKRNALSLDLVESLRRALVGINTGDGDIANATAFDGTGPDTWADLRSRTRAVVISSTIPASVRSLLDARSAEQLGSDSSQVRPLRTAVNVFEGIVHDHGAKRAAFCAGADLTERSSMTLDDVGAFLDNLGSLLVYLEKMSVPTIAAIDGPALGGGLEMALACDFRVVHRSVTALGLPETRLAIIPGAGGTKRLTRLIGPAKAKELIFTGRFLNAQEAVEIGLANAVTSSDAQPAVVKALDLIREFAGNGPGAIKQAKRAIDEGYNVETAEALRVERNCYDELLPTEDRLEGLKAFVEKRKPRYRGV